MTDRIPVFVPLLEQEERDACLHTLDVGWLGMGADVAAFEAAIGELLGLDDDRHVVTVSTGHAALHLGMVLAGVGPGDEVITPAFNNIADFQAVLATGAEPVFCDIDPATLCIDPVRAAELAGPRTKLVVAMDYGTHLADLDAVEQVASAAGARVLHDAAHSFGSSSGGTMVGARSDIAMFSFDPVKTITCIDGGALVVRGGDARDQVREMRLMGMGQPAEVMYQNQRAWTYDVRQLGFRYHLANLHAAIGVAQIAKLDRIGTNRRRYHRAYEEAFADLETVTTPGPIDDERIPFLYYLRVRDGRRDDFRDHLHSNGVDTGIHWQPGHRFELFRDRRRGPLTVTEQVCEEIVTIPLHSEMPDGVLGTVVDVVRSFA